MTLVRVQAPDEFTAIGTSAQKTKIIPLKTFRDIIVKVDNTDASNDLDWTVTLVHDYETHRPTALPSNGNEIPISLATIPAGKSAKYSIPNEEGWTNVQIELVRTGGTDVDTAVVTILGRVEG